MVSKSIFIGISILLVTYTADMMALMVSCIVRTTTTAMTVMPFLLIFQLVFSGTFFSLTGFASKLSLLTIAHWGILSLCAIGGYNQLPMVTLWNTLFKFKDVEIAGEKPLLDLIQHAEKAGYRDDFLLWSGSYNQDPSYVSTAQNVLHTWGALLVLMVVFIVVAALALKAIDRDKR